jgi:hypothetical protein
MTRRPNKHCVRVINVPLLLSPNASSPPFSQHSCGTSVRAFFVGKWLMSCHLKSNLDPMPTNRQFTGQNLEDVELLLV